MTDERLEPLIHKTPAWLEPGAEAADVVIASRIRLARNLADRRFPQQMPAEEAREIVQSVRDRAADHFEGGSLLEPSKLSPADRDFLIERSLASRDLMEAQRPTLIGFTGDESLGMMVNEEDHLRLQGIMPGLDLAGSHALVTPLAQELSSLFELAIHPRYGYLTACPTNVGTGMRASLLLHLPALARAKSPLQRTLQAAQRSYLAVRGVHGEGSGALGHLYQISNQRTLGQQAPDQIQAVMDFGARVLRYERDVREVLLREEGNRRVLDEDVAKALDLLATSDSLTTAEALESLSTLRLAALGGLGEELGIPLSASELLRLTFQLQRGHLQVRIGSELDPEARDLSRARLLRSSLGLGADEGAD